MTRTCGLFCVLFCLASRAQTPAPVTFFNLATPLSSMIQGSDGNLYGVSYTGGTGTCQDVFGTGSCGAVWKITPDGAESVIYSFQPGPEGAYPDPNQIIQGTDGNFYGTTMGGGSGCTSECGTVFKLTPSGTFTTLHAFDGTDGSSPAALVEGNDGNLYGIASTGGATCQFALDPGCGTVFMVTPQGSFTLLYTFDSKHGAGPSSLIKGADGNFYGTTSNGGNVSACPGFSGLIANGCGTVFEITPAGSLTTLYTFQGTSDGTSPSRLIQTVDGNFHGCASVPTENQGSVFKLTPDGTLITEASFDSTNGATPDSLIQASDGNLYGATSGVSGITENGAVDIPAVPGTFFRIAPAGTLTILYNFCQLGCPPPETNGGLSLLQASDGNLYGLTDGGASELFEYSLISPNAPSISASGGVQNGASFQPGISSGSWMTIKGTNLSSINDTWNNSIVNGALPQQLDGVKVSVDGQPAYLEYISSNQINAIAPNVPAGPAQVTVTNSNGTSQAVTAQVAALAPAFFQWGNYAVATRQDFSYAVKNGTFPGTATVAAKPGDVIILWGTGFGATSPSAPAGMETPSTTTYNTANKVSVTVGGMAATFYGAALAPSYAGLYQIAIQIPASLTDNDYPVVATVNGVQSPSSTLITVSTSP
jgi:uncharacterized protein (TIGR03437 family)